MLSLYVVWRRHRPPYRDPRVRPLWVQPYDPSKGMVTLGADDSGAWLVIPDAIAAEVHQLRGYGAAVGEIRLGEAGWQATAYSPSEHRTAGPHLVYPLPPAPTEATACRSLLRWWALRDAEQRQDGTATQLVVVEQAALTA
jgi:hypothetical protein